MGCCFRKKKEALVSSGEDGLGQDQPLIDGQKSPTNGNKGKKFNKAGRPIPEPNMFHKPSRQLFLFNIVCCRR